MGAFQPLSYGADLKAGITEGGRETDRGGEFWQQQQNFRSCGRGKYSGSRNAVWSEPTQGAPLQCLNKSINDFLFLHLLNTIFCSFQMTCSINPKLKLQQAQLDRGASRLGTGRGRAMASDEVEKFPSMAPRDRRIKREEV